MRHPRRYRFHGEGDLSYSTYSMENSRKKSFTADRNAAPASAERRRIGRIVHDDRGNKTVDWHDAPADYRRQVLEVESESPGLAIQKAPRTFVARHLGHGKQFEEHDDIRRRRSNELGELPLGRRERGIGHVVDEPDADAIRRIELER